jgi:hypothetical protein
MISDNTNLKSGEESPPSDVDYQKLIEERHLEIIRNKTPAEKMEMVNNMWHTARKLISMDILSRQPDISNEELNRQIAGRMLHGST